MPVSPPPAECRKAKEPKLKICGLRDPAQAAAIAAMGVDAIGVVAVPGSPRFLAPEERSGLFAAAHSRQPDCVGVLVVADPQDEDLRFLQPGHGHQVVQLHGRETPQRCRELRRALGPDIALWKALRIRCKEDLLRCGSYGEEVEALLLDAWVPDQLGGTGHQIPLDWLEGLDQPLLPWWLAGGIRPETVRAVLERVEPWGLDASSGVEHSPGRKDLQRVAHLLQLVKPLQGFRGEIPVV